MSALIPALNEDPCGRLASLRAVRDKIITGGAAIEVEFGSAKGVTRRAKFGTADLNRLDREISAAEAACGGAGQARPRTFYPRTSKGLT